MPPLANLLGQLSQECLGQDSEFINLSTSVGGRGSLYRFYGRLAGSRCLSLVIACWLVNLKTLAGHQSERKCGRHRWPSNRTAATTCERRHLSSPRQHACRAAATCSSGLREITFHGSSSVSKRASKPASQPASPLASLIIQRKSGQPDAQ